MTGCAHDPDDRAWLPDYARSADLAAAGAAGSTVTVAVDADGGEHLIIVVEGAPRHFEATIPGHEMSTGPLDPDVRSLVDTVAARHADPNTCGRPTSKGRPCRLRVSRPGDACQLHTPQKEAPAARQRDRSE